MKENFSKLNLHDFKTCFGKCVRIIFGICETCLDAGSRQFEIIYEIRDVANCRGKSGL
jgi:hypothetical protein